MKINHKYQTVYAITIKKIGKFFSPRKYSAHNILTIRKYIDPSESFFILVIILLLYSINNGFLRTSKDICSILLLISPRLNSSKLRRTWNVLRLYFFNDAILFYHKYNCINKYNLHIIIYLGRCHTCGISAAK